LRICICLWDSNGELSQLSAIGSGRNKSHSAIPVYYYNLFSFILHHSAGSWVEDEHQANDSNSSERYGSDFGYIAFIYSHSDILSTDRRQLSFPAITACCNIHLCGHFRHAVDG